MSDLVISLAEAERRIGVRDEVGAAASRLCFYRSTLLLEDGWTLRPWTSSTRGSPFTRRCSSAYGTYRDWDDTIVSHPWFDHPYRLVNKAAGRTLFCVEPYNVEPAAVVAIGQWCTDHGWDFELSADQAIHFPGWTVRLAFEQQREP